jgi:pimeloyl-ACP methyl ester carboxylesterase
MDNSPSGVPEAPKALVFLPGLLCDERLWRDQAAALSTTVAVTMADLTQDDSVAGMAARVLAIAPERFSLAALSMGGYVAFEILRQAPERVVRLALLDTSAAPDNDARSTQRRAAMNSLQSGRFMGVTNRMLPQLVHVDHVAGSVGQEVRAMAERVGAEAFLRQQQAILMRPDSRPLLATLRMPTLVGVGDADVMTPPFHAEEIHQGIAGSVLYRFARCGHLPPMEAPEETTDVLKDWLSCPA